MCSSQWLIMTQKEYVEVSQMMVLWGNTFHIDIHHVHVYKLPDMYCDKYTQNH